MSFNLAGSLDPHGGPVLRSEIVRNSITIQELDSVTSTASGFIDLGVTAWPVLGHVKALQTNAGVGLDTTGIAGAESGTFVGTFLTASNNQTVAKVRAAVDVSKMTLYSVNPNAAIATTTGSDLLGFHTDIAGETTTSESSATTATAQYTIWGVDPLTAANQIVSICESQVFGHVGTGLVT